ncbi:aminotransferase class IV family protein [Phaeobacter gallaeciensis]|uniref:aminotransferase class IV family protein n=1 Tax=Phaeobacter gallaeciensis TaxID=60890 RepID=UPI00237EEF82|nr:aminotransferase class IV family protein [Phaeobacter gallaeciensis]MDE4191720.1 aminotransferase class IV family protein [Phaeobacter gallaeciensis]MDE4200183.1 aminotransferase class IV family protein [Phaeobacter gallaeciensis]MDE4204369.1 aminotransferase class IV family protein [Phaeobacter gallaeciensis]MDE4208475.1 aminotransferase class IV family protein [Phaeobacter gallaeciensis]MDE4216878.1 aminotransferase class IV family protein [Phaeobacter gallaeciensis]
MESPVRPDDATCDTISDTIKGDPAFRLIETLGWYPGEGGRHQPRHLARMRRSAAAFGIPFDLGPSEAMLAEIVSDTPLRCRLTLDVEGRFDMTTAPLGKPPAEWRLGIADIRLDADDPWLRHKTTRRVLYDSARADLPEGIDELVFLNQRDEVCEGTITNIFVTLAGGQVVTPPLSCGLLPGILRQEMLERGQCAEAVLHLADLKGAQAIHMGNSLRGLIPAKLV